MTVYIKRATRWSRVVHDVHTAATIVLMITGMVLFVPQIARALSVPVLKGLSLGHHGAAGLFVGVPLISVLFRPKAARAFLAEFFAPWTPEDWEFMRKFVPYLFNPKIHMPKQDHYKSGQRVADGAMVLFAITITVSGAVMSEAQSMPAALVRWMYVVHDASFVILAVLVLAHVYLGAGIFEPYRGTGRIMFGDGLVSAQDAEYHWGFWADEELESCENLVDVPDPSADAPPLDETS
jgi:formate dehydrogenase subunit gamma